MDPSQWKNAEFTGNSFTLAETTAMSNSLVLLGQSTGKGNVRLWGKVYAYKADYLICQVAGGDALTGVLTFYSIDGGVSWNALDAVAEGRAKHCAVLRGTYMGEPAYEYRIEGSDVTVKESERLSYFVAAHDNACRVVPRGAFVITVEGAGLPPRVRVNPTFDGLDTAAAGRLTSYYHLRKERRHVPLIESEGTDSSIDFLDPVSDDIPQGAWQLRYDNVSGTVYGVSLKFLGAVFYHRAATTDYGNFYMGKGEVNGDICFMM
jgi:hypothetical protein